MKLTKEQLIKDKAILEAKLENRITEDNRVREVLSELLDSYEYTQEYGYSNSKIKKVLTRSWEGIAFLIGELKADANYAMCIEAREDLKVENNVLKQRIHDLEKPKPIK